MNRKESVWQEQYDATLDGCLSVFAIQHLNEVIMKHRFASFLPLAAVLMAASVLVTLAQNAPRDEQWKQVDDAVRKGLPKTAVERLEHGRFVARCNWIARGSVGHWGHIHQQANEYSALITVQPVDGAWKISGLNLTDEQRSVPDRSASGQR